MYKKTYDRFKDFIGKCKYGESIINILNNITTSLVYITYPSVLIILFLNKDIRIWKTILIPGISFIIISIFRSYVDFPRPYEVYDIRPIINKDTKGKSFPSRHVFSAFVIGGTLFKLWPILGAILLAMGMLIAILRVIGGVHFPRDVLFGGAFGILLAFLGWRLF